MVLDGTLADAKMRGDILAGTTGDNQFHDLALSWCQTRKVVSSGQPPSNERTRGPRPFGMALTVVERFAVADRQEELRTCKAMSRTLGPFECHARPLHHFLDLVLKGRELLVAQLQFVLSR